MDETPIDRSRGRRAIEVLVHVLQESFRVLDGVVIPVPDAGKSQGLPRAYPPHALPRAFGGHHVLDLLVKEVFSCSRSNIPENFVVVTATRVLVNVLRKLALSRPPMRRV